VGVSGAFVIAASGIFDQFCLYRFVTLFWPLDVKADKLQSIHAKLVQQSGKKVGQAGGAPAPSAQSNGHR